MVVLLSLSTPIVNETTGYWLFRCCNRASTTDRFRMANMSSMYLNQSFGRVLIVCSAAFFEFCLHEHFKATFPAVHFDARKSQRAGAFASAAGKDFAYSTHSGMFERCQRHPAPAHYISVEENSRARRFLAQSSPSTFFQNYAQQIYRKLPKTTKTTQR